MSGQDAPTQHKKLLPYGELPPQQHPPVKTSRVGPVRQILRVNRTRVLLFIPGVVVLTNSTKRLAEHVESMLGSSFRLNIQFTHDTTWYNQAKNAM